MERFGGRLTLTVIFLLLALLPDCNGDHYRGAMIYWKQSRTNHQTIDLDYVQAWRRSSLSPPCTDPVISRQTIMTNDLSQHDLQVSSSAAFYHHTILPFEFQCTGFSIREDWVSGKGRSHFKPSVIDGSAEMFFVRFVGCCWILYVNQQTDGRWSLVTVVNTTTRGDTGRMNQSPRVDLPPIVRLQYGCNHTINIPVSDDDGDDVRCRWATRSNNNGVDECGGACGIFPHATINERECSITYGAHYSLGWYAVTVQIEDFRSKTSAHALSSVPLQFLVHVERQSGDCASYEREKPQFVGLTLPDKACIGIRNSTDFTTDIYIDSRSNGSISELNTVSPIGLVKSSLQRVHATGTWHVSVTWNPNTTDTVNNVFCFTAVDTHGLSSEQRCVTMLAGIPPAVILPSSRSPSTSVIPTSQHQWSVEFDRFDGPANRSAFVYLYLANGTLVESVDVTSAAAVTFTRGARGTVLTFTTATDLQPGQTYYFLFGQGIVHGNSFCGAGSSSVTDTTFWRFTVAAIPEMPEIVKVQCSASMWHVDIDINKLRQRYPGSVDTDIYLGESTCQGHMVNGHLQIDYGFSSCQTSETTTNDKLVFTNQLVYAYHDPAHPFIIRSYNWTLDITCLVMRNESTHSAVEYNQSTSVDATANPIGGFQLKIELFSDPNYMNKLSNGPIKVALGTAVYVKAHVDDVDWSIKMRLNTCYMTPSSTGNSNAYYIIQNGCESDVNTHVISQAAHETRFEFSMFDMSANQGGLYLQCDAIYCDTSDPASLPPCQKPCGASG